MKIPAGVTPLVTLPKEPPSHLDPKFRWAMHNGLLIALTHDIGAQGGWRHVSFSRRSRLPSWDDLKRVRSSYFAADVVVVQFFPEQENYVNVHEYCLHLWSWLDGEFPFPEASMLL